MKKTRTVPTKKKPRKSAKKPVKKNTGFKAYLPIVGLFTLAIFLGIGLFFLLNPAEKYAFHNPFKILKTKVIPATKNYSVDYDEYQDLSQHLSFKNKERVQTFLNENPNSTLAMKLRNDWLLFLAAHDKWRDFLEDYQATNNQAVECFYLKALYDSGKQTLALSGVKRLWLAGYQHINTCNEMFVKWQHSPDFKEEYIWPRLQLAINQKDNVSINQLKQMLPTNQQHLVTNWLSIRINPTELNKISLPDSDAGRTILLDGLKQWTAIDVNQAIQYWNQIQNKYTLSEAQIQNFYLDASLHLALQGNSEAEKWFAKILPPYSTAESRSWQVRFALMHQDWSKVLILIDDMPDNEKNTNMWQYWKARAEAKSGNPAIANQIYNHLSAQRQYYGFLAAYQQHKTLAIQQIDYPKKEELLLPYAKQIQQIQILYQKKQWQQALQLTADLLNQLDDPGKYALANRLAEWEWYPESMMITNRTPYQGDLRLRFPMPHQTLITELCTSSQLSPALVYAIARQESNFHEDVFSSAGGLGILQLTLATAKQFVPDITEKYLYDPDINIKIGIAYLSRLTQQFAHHPLLVASAYNAGPQKTRRWQPSKASIPADIWIEIRPWGETRNYMKNVLAYYAVYQYLLEKKPDISPFMQDIPPAPH